MSIPQIIEELEAVKDYFLEEFNGCSPLCIDKAIEELKKHIKK